MSRQARIDACPCVFARIQARGALRYILIRGIEQRRISEDDKDRSDRMDYAPTSSGLSIVCPNCHRMIHRS